MWSFDDWVPNFTLFVLLLTPLVCVLVFSLAAFARYLRVRGTKPKRTLLEFAGYLPIVYMIFPMWDIGQYLLGYREFITERLFVFHFANLLSIIVLVGIVQVVYIIFKGSGDLGLNEGVGG